jgi:hypothetical protein
MLGYTLGADDGANLLVVPALNRHQDIQDLELPNTWPGNHKAPSFFVFGACGRRQSTEPPRIERPPLQLVAGTPSAPDSTIARRHIVGANWTQRERTLRDSLFTDPSVSMARAIIA